MIVFKQTSQFANWLSALRDTKARARILARLRSAQAGNFGDCAFVGEGIFEMRLHLGPGYRLYYTRTAGTVYLLLVGGDKSTQQRDIEMAKELAHNAKRMETESGL